MPVADKTAQKITKHAAGAAGAARQVKSSTSILGTTIGATNSALSTAQMGLFLLPMLSGILGWVGKAPVVGGFFKKASDVVAAPTNFATSNTVGSALDKAHDKLSGLVGPETLSKAGDVTSRASGALESAVGKADGYIKGVSKGFNYAKDKISGVKGLTVHDAIWKGSIYAGSALMAYQNVKTTTAGISTLKDMVQDLSPDGKRPSTWKVLFGNVPDCVKQMRGQFLVTSAMRTIADVVGIGVNTKFAQNQNMSFKKSLLLSLGLQSGVGMITSLISKGNNSADLYATMKTSQASGQALPPQLIAEFIGSASKDAKASGGAENSAVQILAKKYAAEGLTAENILAKVNSGEINQDRAALKSTQVMQSRGQVQQPAAAPKDNLRVMPSPKMPSQPVVGAHTANLANVRQMPQPFGMPVGRVA